MLTKPDGPQTIRLPQPIDDLATGVVRDFDATGVLTIWLGLIFLVPSRWVVPGLGAAGRPAGLFALAMFCLWAVVTIMPNLRTRRSVLRWPLAFWALSHLISYLLGYGRGLLSVEALGADRAVLNLISSLGAVLLVSECVPSLDSFDRLTKRLTYFGTYLAVIGMIQFFFKFDPYSVIRIPGLVLNSGISGLGNRGATNLVRARGSTTHAIEFAVVLAQVLPFALHYANHEPHPIIRKRRMTMVAIIGVAGLLAVSRSAVLAMAASGLVMFWVWSPKVRIRAAVLAVFGIAAVRVAVPGLLGTILALFTNWNNDPSISGRTDDYAAVSVYIRDRPWFGRGIGTFNAHDYILLDNTYLNKLAESGVIGTMSIIISVLAAMILAGSALRNHPSPRTRHLAAAVVATLACAALSAGTFDFFFFRTATAMLMFGMGAAAIVARRGEPSQLDAWAPPGLLRAPYQVGVNYSSWLSRLVGRTPEAEADESAGPSPWDLPGPRNETEPIEA